MDLLLPLSLGLLAASSLPIGAALGLALKPSARATAALMAFGCGTLLFALSVELVAGSHDRAGFLPVAAGCVVGGLLFEALNHGISSSGGFLRKTATLVRHVTRLRRKRAELLLGHVSQVDLVRFLPPAELARLVPHADEVRVDAGEVLCTQGDEASAIVVIEEGTVDIRRHGAIIGHAGRGEVLGAEELMRGRPHAETVIAATPLRLHRIPREDFDRLVDLSPACRERLDRLAADRAAIGSAADPTAWRRTAIRSLDDDDLSPTGLESREAVKAHLESQGSMGIWFGNLLDAVPESLVLGMMARGGTGISFALLGGVFLANLPEALSSSVVMKSHGFSTGKILALWSSIVVVGGAAAVAGGIFLPGASPATLAIVEGIAAGAMLTMIAETMLPEAYEQGGAVVGLSTLAGFLAALLLRIPE